MILGTATDYIDLSNQIVALAGARRVIEAAINGGGSGYTVGDILTAVGGTSLIAATLEVTSVSSGVVDGVRVYNNGGYTVDPSNPVSVTGGTGTGATFDLTLADNGWEVERDTTHNGDVLNPGTPTSDREVILKGEGGGTDEIYIGWRTFYDSVAGYYNWELQGFTGFDSGMPFTEQPGGRGAGHFNQGTATLRSGCYLVCQNSSFPFWLNITPYRIQLTVRAGGNYFHAYLGWGNRYATDVEYPYPLIISGTAANRERIATASGPISGLPDPQTDETINENGPTMIMMPDYTWRKVQHRRGTTATDLSVLCITTKRHGISASSIPDEDKYIQVNPWMKKASLFAATGSSTLTIFPDPGGYRTLLPTVIAQLEVAAKRLLMEADGVFVVFAQGGVQSEDRVIAGDEVYWVFQNGTRTELHTFVAIKA